MTCITNIHNAGSADSYLLKELHIWLVGRWGMVHAGSGHSHWRIALLLEPGRGHTMKRSVKAASSPNRCCDRLKRSPAPVR